MDYETIDLAQREYRRNGQVRPFFARKCAGCGWKYRVHIDPDVSPPLLRTVVWEARP